MDATTRELLLTITDKGDGLRGRTMADLSQDFGGDVRGTRRSVAHYAGDVRSSGIGIPICVRLAGLMDGSLLVADRSDGVTGTVFLLRLPLMPCESIAPAPLPGERPPRVATAPVAGTQPHEAVVLDDSHAPVAVAGVVDSAMPQQVVLSAVVSAGTTAMGAASIIANARVLVGDDSAANRRFAAFVLRQLGCQASGEVDDGDGVVVALDAAVAAGTPYDAVLIDMVMVRMNGDAAFAALRAAGHALPVVAATGNATADDAARYRAAGFAGVLPKPFTRADMESLLVEVLSGTDTGR